MEEILKSLILSGLDPRLGMLGSSLACLKELSCKMYSLETHLPVNSKLRKL